MTDRRSVPPSVARLATPRAASVLVAVAAAAAVAAVHLAVFPHLSVNHDEGVYLQQAAMLLDGRLAMHADPVADAVRPWFFVQDAGRLYPKYTPVTAAVFALGKLLAGSYAAALPAVAFTVVYGTTRLTAAAFDERTGVLAGVLVATSPLFLLTTATFLSYAPTTALNLVFAVAYVRAVRARSARWAAAAGLAVGLAFFARPYTAVLFAAPFVAHAVLAIAGTWRADDRERLRGLLRRTGVVAALGASFVGVALAYNAVLTGDPLVFPYRAFAPADGIGFGHREILGHEADYTPAVAVRANATVLWALATDWFAAPPFGTILALGGVGAVLARIGERWPPTLPDGTLSDGTLRVLLLGVLASVVVGNVPFWGNLNVLGNPAVADDGLVSVLGPFYHFDLLVPLGAFAAHAAVRGWDRLAPAIRERAHHRQAAVALAVVLAVAPLAVADATAVDARLDRNAAHADRLDRAYAPFEDRSFEHALVFVPTPYGAWLNHPFQELRNDPGLDGPAVYALDRDPAGDFAVLDAFPDRRPYRYTYRGRWSGDPDSRVTPKLVALQEVSGEQLRVRTTLGVPEGARVSTVRLEADGEATSYRPAGDADGQVTLAWVVTADDARIVDGGARDAGTVSFAGPSSVSLAVTVIQPGGATLTYRQDLSVAPADEGVRALWPPETRVCRLTPDCGTRGTYLPEHPDEHVAGVSVNATVRSSDGS